MPGPQTMTGNTLGCARMTRAIPGFYRRRHHAYSIFEPYEVYSEILGGIPAGANEERYAKCLESTTLCTRFGLADLTERMLWQILDTTWRRLPLQASSLALCLPALLFVSDCISWAVGLSKWNSFPCRIVPRYLLSYLSIWICCSMVCQTPLMTYTFEDSFSTPRLACHYA